MKVTAAENWRDGETADHWDESPYDEMELVATIGALRSQAPRRTKKRSRKRPTDG
jgi:hypothetical protein